MIRSIILLLSVAVIIISYTSCANQIALTGGPRDELAPQLDTAGSSKNNLTLFEKHDILLQFDEYVDLRDASKQIVISPPLTFPPIIESRLKNIKFKFNEKEILKDDVTYIINFGKSIRDYTEGNELLNFTYVFSTGEYIDSLSLKGRVIDSRTRKPKEDALVLLYIEDRDSIVFLEKPFYFAHTDKTGNFQINNLRADTFKMVTITDPNLNYLYDPLTEEIGFLDSTIILTSTQSASYELEIFKEETTPRYKSYEMLARGKARIDFDGGVNKEALVPIDSLENFISFEKDDQFLTLWYRPSDTKSLRYEVIRSGMIDTIQVRINTRIVDTLDGHIKITAFNFDTKVGLHPLLPLEIKFDRPVDSINWSLISFVDTLSKDNMNVTLDSSLSTLPSMSIWINSDWPEERVLDCTFYPGAFIDFFGKSHDTIVKQVRIAQEADFGTIKLNPVGFDSIQYVIQLLKTDKVVKEQLLIPGQQEIIFDRLVPATYTVQVIADLVPNGRWDPGNYMQKRYSEKIYTLPLTDLRANWVLEEELDLQQIISQSVVKEPQAPSNER